MKIPIIIKSDKILDRLSWFMKIGGITLWPWIIVRPKMRKNTINHETIHIKQQQELLVLPFYLLYGLEWLIRLVIYRNTRKAYYNLSFEREAYTNAHNFEYVAQRKPWSWVKYL